ncbi:hypothetical protein ACQKWADRAFT_303800 [Trichoderma austrokoningii]
MAAVSSTCVRDADSLAVREILQAAVALYRDVLALYHDGDASSEGGSGLPDELLSNHHARLRESVQALTSIQPVVAASDVPHTLTIMPACRKVGQDLVLHLDRAISSDHESSFRDIWPARDVAALGARLQHLHQQFHDDVDDTFEVRRLPLLEFIAAGEKKHVWGDDRSASQQAEPQEVDKEKPKTRRITIVPGDNVYIEIPIRKRAPPDSIVHDYILDILSYKSMHYREQEVAKAHSKTFEWVFQQSSPEEPEHQFSTWLRGEELGPIYWITGKPGSGKSTFIRFLFDHESTMERLGIWAKGKPIFRAGFFFWTSGSREQRSQAGLLRSLLHQFLSAYPELAEAAFPSLWKKLKTMDTKERVRLELDFSVADLLEAFQAAVDAAMLKMNICLFIDGLDEFEGDHLAMIDFFKNLCLGKKGQSIKICLSSRPWAVFQNAFEYAVPNLRLQDLTYEDMYRYTKDRLREKTHIRRLLKNDATAGEDLIQQAVRKSDGVFLWVRLALDEMIRTFQQETGLAGLSKTLDMLPIELNELFNLFFFENQDEAQLAEAAVISSLMNARELVADFVSNDAATALTVWELAFALRGSDDDEAAEKEEPKQASPSVAHERCLATMSLVMERFSGLLEIHARRDSGNARGLRFSGKEDNMNETLDAAERRVTYIHRTVRDWFMEDPGVMSRLVSKTPAEFDPHLRLLRSYVLQMKNSIEEIEHHRQLDEWWPGIALALTHARYVQNDPHHMQRTMVNEVERSISWYWLSKPEDPYDHWARYGLGPYRVFKSAAPLWQPFLCLATRFGLTRYVSEEVTARNAADGQLSAEKKALQSSESTPLLVYATEFLCSRKKTIFPLSDIRLVEFLLRNQCRINRGPNDDYNDFETHMPRTPWITLLRHLRDARRRNWIEYYDVDPEGTARWAEIVRLFVEVGGADKEAVVLKDGWDPEITALGVMQLLEATYGAVEMRELVKLWSWNDGRR